MALKVLLLGGHGRVSLHLTPLLLARSWTVTSVVRSASHADEIKSLCASQPGTLKVLTSGLTSPSTSVGEHARSILASEEPDVVIWAAGAGGKGGAARTYEIDRDAATAWISAALGTVHVRKFLMVSYIASRRGYAPWWTAEDRQAADKVNTETLPDYAKAKVVADEHLLAETEKRRRAGDDGFQMINLRPGTLTDDKATGKVKLGKTGSRGNVSREDVAAVAVALLARDDTRGYFDLLEGDEGIEDAVDRLVSEGHTGTEGEDLQTIFGKV